MIAGKCNKCSSGLVIDSNGLCVTPNNNQPQPVVNTLPSPQNNQNPQGNTQAPTQNTNSQNGQTQTPSQQSNSIPNCQT